LGEQQRSSSSGGASALMYVVMTSCEFYGVTPVLPRLLWPPSMGFRHTKQFQTQTSSSSYLLLPSAYYLGEMSKLGTDMCTSIVQSVFFGIFFKLVTNDTVMESKLENA